MDIARQVGLCDAECGLAGLGIFGFRSALFDQERIVRMAEAPRTDESRRRDQITAAQTSVIKRAQWIQAADFFACIGALTLDGVRPFWREVLITRVIKPEPLWNFAQSGATTRTPTATAA